MVTRGMTSTAEAGPATRCASSSARLWIAPSSSRAACEDRKCHILH